MSVDELYVHKGIEKDPTGYGEYLGVYDIADRENFCYEFGKYTEFDDKKFFKPVFKNKETQAYYDSEHDFWIVGKEYLELIINHYTDKVRNSYNEMLTPFLDKDSDHRGSEFLNSVKTEYKLNGNEYTFDFSKMSSNQQTMLFKIFEHMRSMRMEWVSFLPYDLKSGNEVTTSWKYEYNVFELVRIYKTFDFKKNHLIYYGY
jgi:hypothetical protein